MSPPCFQTETSGAIPLWEPSDSPKTEEDSQSLTMALCHLICQCLCRGVNGRHISPLENRELLRDSQGPLTDPRVISWVTVPLTPGNMLRFVYVCLPFSFRWADVHAVSSKEKATPLPIHQRVAHSRKRRRPEENLGIRKLWISKGAFSAEIDDDSGIINYAKRRTKRTHTHSRMLVFSRCWVVNESHLFTASTDR